MTTLFSSACDGVGDFVDDGVVLNVAVGLSTFCISASVICCKGVTTEGLELSADAGAEDCEGDCANGISC